MNKYKEALARLSGIDLDRVLEKLGYKESDRISDYGMCDYPNLEKQSDIETLLELVKKATPMKPTSKEDIYDDCEYIYTRGICLGCKEWIVSVEDFLDVKYCPHCGQKLDWNEETCDDSVTCVDFSIDDIE